MTMAWIRRWSRFLHRDGGYFLATLVIVYSLSGIALNHHDAWNPDFVVQKRQITLPQVYAVTDIQGPVVEALRAQVGEGPCRVVDSPTDGIVKLYFDRASLLLHLDQKRGEYERIVRRPLFWDANVLHRNSLKVWRWFSDGFAIFLILVSVTGLLILKGSYGFGGRGKWLMLAGTVPPLVAVFWFRTH